MWKRIEAARDTDRRRVIDTIVSVLREALGYIGNNGNPIGVSSNISVAFP